MRTLSAQRAIRIETGRLRKCACRPLDQGLRGCGFNMVYGYNLELPMKDDYSAFLRKLIADADGVLDRD